MALTPPQYKQMKQFLESDQRNKKTALLQDDLEPGPLKDEMKGNFDPTQETYEEYLRRINLAKGGRVPFNKGKGVKDRYSELMGMSLEELQKLGFTGDKKTTKVKSPSGKSYSKMTDELKEFIRSQTKKENPLRKSTVRPALDRVSDQILKAYANDDIRFIVTRDKFNKIGNFSKDDFRLLTQIKNDPDSLAIVAQNTGLDPDTILNLLEDRDAFIDLERYEPIRKAKDKKLYGDRKKFFKSAERWIMTNSKRYADPENLKKAFIRTFGKDNPLIKAINSGSTTGLNVNFSDWFKQTILGGTPKTSYNSKALNDIFKTAIYTNNKNVQNKILNEFKRILPEPGSKRTVDIRDAFRRSNLLTKFGINNAIKGPIARLISNNIGKDMMKQISMFRDPFLGTADLLNFLSDRVDPKYKSMFNEAENAVRYAQNNQWPLAKKALNNSQAIMFDHKIPKEIINLGYADEIEYIKLNPTSAKFNQTIKRTQFDVPMVKLIKEFETANNLNAKTQIINKMNKLKSSFSKKYGGYLDEVSIDVDKTGKPVFKSSAAPVTKTTDFVSSLGKSMTQAGEIDEQQFKKLVATLSKDPRCQTRGFKNQGGRVGFQDGSASLDVCFRGGIDNINRGLPNPTAAQARNFGKVAAFGRGVIKFGVLPEALFLAGESVIRMGMGDTLPEAILRASEYLLPFNQTKIADRMMLSRTVGPKTAELILKANELRGFEDRIQNLENEKQFTGILTDDGFDDNFFGQTKVEQENAIQNQIDALNNLRKKYGSLTESQFQFADMQAQEAEDIKTSRALFPKLLAKARSVDIASDDPLAEGIKETINLDLKMLPSRFERQINLDVRDPVYDRLVNTPKQELSNFYKGQELENILRDKKFIEDYRKETVSEAAALNPEAMFSASTGLPFGEPLDKGVSYTPPPIDTITEMEREITGQTNLNERGEVINPFDIDRPSLATGLRGFAAAGGGIAKLAGIDKGPQRVSMNPDSQGLQGLMKRVKRI